MCCTCLIFLHYASSNESSKHLHKRMHSHIGCTCLTFLHCEFLMVDILMFLNQIQLKRNDTYTGCNCKSYFCNDLPWCEFSRCPHICKHSCKGCIWNCLHPPWYCLDKIQKSCTELTEQLTKSGKVNFANNIFYFHFCW